ncbi:MAG: ATP-binding protein [Planctomycetaceae bacterium]|jgi:hypothetical protein|nr:ATP-binding protein [Planctomycetaceae bacterium]
MFFTLDVIETSIKRLAAVHPFFGITFLTCKQKKLPVGCTTDISLNNITKEHLDSIHKICSESSLYYQPFHSYSRNEKWVDSNYPSTELQAINTQSFQNVFLHDKETAALGWQDDYVKQLVQKLNGSKLSVIDLAIWIFKNKDWSETTTLNDVSTFFIDYFNITEAEKVLFSFDLSEYQSIQLLQDNCVSWSDYCRFISIMPSDISPAHGAILSFLSLTNIGPVTYIEMSPNRRLNIITGDNGLGKTFLLDAMWRAMTGMWAENPAYPRNTEKKSEITYCLANGKNNPSPNNIIYDVHNGVWQRNKKSSAVSGIMIYARVDGSYTTHDPVVPADIVEKQNRILSFNDVLNGVNGTIEGLIRDWVKWRMDIKKYPFNILVNVLKEISPPDMGELQPGQPIRVPNEPREIPTIIHPYGEIPIIHASAGVKRIISLAYLIVWTWHEHKENAKLYKRPVTNRMVIIIDEIEAHLHPKWQRTILPALLDIQKYLSDELDIQFFISTHSPLVLASVETCFDQQTDQLFHLKQDHKNATIEISEEAFQVHGQIGSWLVSPIFELKHARSKEAELAIEKAKSLQLQDSPKTIEVASVHAELLRCLSETDSFWPRWIFFAEKNGVKI